MYFGAIDLFYGAVHVFEVGFSLRDINFTLGLLPSGRHQIWRDPVGVGSSAGQGARWLSWIFGGGYLPSLNINGSAQVKIWEKGYHDCIHYKDENFLQFGVYGNVMMPFLFFNLSLCFSVLGVFFKKWLKGVCTCHNCLNHGKV